MQSRQAALLALCRWCVYIIAILVGGYRNGGTVKGSEETQSSRPNPTDHDNDDDHDVEEDRQQRSIC